MTTVKKNIFIKYTVATVMILVIGLQFILVRTVYISPWKAGGFGMFSTINTPVSHIVRVFANAGTGKMFPLLFPEKFESYERNIRHLATQSTITALKKALQKERWIIKDSSFVIAPGNDKNPLPVKINMIRVELWAYHFDAANKKFYSTLMAEF